MSNPARAPRCASYRLAAGGRPRPTWASTSCAPPAPARVDDDGGAPSGGASHGAASADRLRAARSLGPGGVGWGYL